MLVLCCIQSSLIVHGLLFFDAIKLQSLLFSLQVLAKYDSGAEREVKDWIKELTGEDIGTGAMEVEKKLRNGSILVKYT